METEFSNKTIKSLKRRGIFAYKTSDRFSLGVPDIYVAGGRWIESKVVSLGSQDHRVINIFGKLSAEQHNFANALIRAGDTVYVSVRLQFPDANHLMFIIYQHIELYPFHKVGELRKYPPITSEKNYDIPNIQ